MDTVIGFVAGLGGIALAVVVVAFVIGWLLLRRSARKLKETT